MTDLTRKSKDQQYRDNLINENFTIIANNCIGGIIYHNLGLKFLSPTINLWFTPKDYIKLLQHPHDYLPNTSMKEDNSNKLPHLLHLTMAKLKFTTNIIKTFQIKKINGTITLNASIGTTY